MIHLDRVAVSVPVWADGGARSSRTLLHDVTVELAERRIAVIGANGSGKSTLLRLLNGLVTPSSGSVRVEGLDTVRQARQVRRRVGFIFTDPLSQLVMSTPVEDVELSLRRTVRDRAERHRRAEALLAERGLAHVATQSIYDLSGGERQLVSLTSVLAVQPTIVVADEPTTLLDLRNRDHIVAALLGLDTQLVYATHDLDFAALADRAVVVDDGRICFDGPPGPAIDHYRALMA